MATEDINTPSAPYMRSGGCGRRGPGSVSGESLGGESWDGEEEGEEEGEIEEERVDKVGIYWLLPMETFRWYTRQGEDTRKSFTDHLYTALVQAGIHTFRDEDEIQKGENINSELQQAIQKSKILIIVFSEDYAWSRCCLDELLMIMERTRTASCSVLPVFYNVDPTEVRNQTGSFTAAFVEHEKRFQEEMERVKRWRIALKKVADLGGMVLGDGYEAQFVQSIVERVSKKLDRKIFYVPFHFIGRDPLVKYINSWLLDGSDGAAISILYGIGGVGKIAIAKSAYNQNFQNFKGRSFLSNVRERSKEPNGIVCLQRQLLSDILNKTVDEIYDVDEGIMKIKDALCCRKTLIILDDVDKRDQFNAIIGMKNWVCQGSKIIVTTRNKALRAIGSSLFGKQREVWESVLHEMEEIPNCDVQKVLGISYDSLDDDYQKSLFLDIACFFSGMDEDYAVRILDGLGIGAKFRIDNLIDRCLVEIVEINNDKRLWMHQLVRDMGREIARQESSKCQRIWHHVEAFTILKETHEAETLRGLTVDMHALMEVNCTDVVCTDSMVCRKRQKLNFFQHRRIPTFISWEWLPDFFMGEKVQIGQTSLFLILSTDAFRKMQNVKFLQLNYMKFYGSYEHFPKNMIWLCWMDSL
uniref:TIR domain-containing protein n=1 Tax=Populus trichocarpa TaxID=3694 RepID=A0A2K1YG68_POPTR